MVCDDGGVVQYAVPYAIGLRAVAAMAGQCSKTEQLCRPELITIGVRGHSGILVAGAVDAFAAGTAFAAGEQGGIFRFQV